MHIHLIFFYKLQSTTHDIILRGKNSQTKQKELMRLFNDYPLRCYQKFLPGVYDPSLKDAQEAHNFNLKRSRRLNKKLQHIAPAVYLNWK